MATTTTMSGAAFDQLPFEEGRHWELVEGELIEVPSPTPRHQRVAGTLFLSLGNYFGREPIGEVLQESEFALGEDDRLRPDVAILLGEHWDSIDLDKSPIPMAPDVAVEVISPSERADNSQRKVDRYLAAGTKEVWQFWPSRLKLLVYRGLKSITPLDMEDTLTTPLLPGWEISVRRVFSVRRGGGS